MSSLGLLDAQGGEVGVRPGDGAVTVQERPVALQIGLERMSGTGL